MKTIKTWNGKVHGFVPSPYARQNGYLDYHTLAKMLEGMILNNSIYSATNYEDWELFNGWDFWAYDEDGNEVEPYSDEEYDREYYEIYQFYIINERGAEVLAEYTDEIVYYNEKLDIYLWGVTHFGTSWDYVLTNVKLVEGNTND